MMELSVCRIEQGHNLCTTAKGADGEPSADELAHGRQIGVQPIYLLGTTISQTHCDDLIEDQDRVHGAAGFGELIEEGWIERNHSRSSHDGLNNYRRQVIRIRLKYLACSFEVIRRDSHDVSQDSTKNTRLLVGHRSLRSPGRTCNRGIMEPVISALKLQHLI